MSSARLGGLLCLALLLLQCSCDKRERVVLVMVSVAPDVPAESVVQLEARTSLDRFMSGTPFVLVDQTGQRRASLPYGIGIYHHMQAGELTVLVHAVNGQNQRIAGGAVDFVLTPGNVDNSSQDLTLAPCILPSSGDLTQICAMPGPVDGGDAGMVADAASDTDAGGEGDVGPGDSGDAVADTSDALADSGDSGQVCPPGDGLVLAPVDAGATPPACESYCETVVAQCPDLFARLPGPSLPGGDPSPQEVCRRSCTTSGLADDPNPSVSALDCRVMSATEVGPALNPCLDASLLSPNCNLGTCEAYCRMNATVCGVDYSSCYYQCRSLPYASLDNGSTSNPLVCRMVWLERAIFDPLACGAAQPSPSCGPCQPPP